LAKDAVTVETEREVYSRNEIVRVRTEVHDAAFNRMNDARIEASITTPSGNVSTVLLDWTAQDDGVYEGEWTTDEDGRHEVSVTAYAPGEEGKQYGSATSSFLTSTGSREYFEAAQHVDLLRRLSEETGGRYYSIDDAGQIPEEILYTEKQATTVEVLDLWDMPFNFLLILSLLGAEWIWRRKHGTI
jgi:hypothetical protein